MNKLKSLQIVRFVAATMVVWAHASHYFLGSAGVDVFFVLSGYIIATVAKNKTAYLFMRDRLIRIFPLYYAFTIPVIIVILVKNMSNLDNFGDVFVTITLWPVYNQIKLPILSMCWTLSFELLFYMCATSIIAWRWCLYALPCVYLLSLLATFVSPAPIFRFIGNPLILEFGFGIALSTFKSNRRKLGVVAIIAAAAAFAVSAYGYADRFALPNSFFDLTVSDRVYIWGIPATLAVWGALQMEPLSGRICEVLSNLGDASYSIYLSHPFVLLIAATVLPWPLTVILAIAFGVVVHKYIEKPLAVFARSIWVVDAPDGKSEKTAS